MVRKVRAEVVAARVEGVSLSADWNDVEGNETYIMALFKAHPTLGNGYPVLLRDIVHNRDFSEYVCKKYFKWVSNTPDPRKNPSENAFLRTQAEYVYFDAMQGGKGKAKSREMAEKAYTALSDEDREKKMLIDASVAAYRKKVLGAKQLCIDRLRAAVSAAAAPAEKPAPETAPADL